MALTVTVTLTVAVTLTLTPTVNITVTLTLTLTVTVTVTLTLTLTLIPIGLKASLEWEASEREDHEKLKVQTSQTSAFKMIGRALQEFVLDATGMTFMNWRENMNEEAMKKKAKQMKKLKKQVNEQGGRQAIAVAQALQDAEKEQVKAIIALSAEMMEEQAKNIICLRDQIVELGGSTEQADALLEKVVM